MSERGTQVLPTSSTPTVPVRTAATVVRNMPVAASRRPPLSSNASKSDAPNASQDQDAVHRQENPLREIVVDNKGASRQQVPRNVHSLILASTERDVEPIAPVFEMPHMALTQGLDAGRSDKLATLSTAVIVLWPFSIILPPFVVGWSATATFLRNLGFLPDNSTDVADEPAVASVRRSLFVFHNVVTALMFAAYSALTYILYQGMPTGESNAVSWHMCWLQGLVVALVLFPRRLSLAGIVYAHALLLQRIPTTRFFPTLFAPLLL